MAPFVPIGVEAGGQERCRKTPFLFCRNKLTNQCINRATERNLEKKLKGRNENNPMLVERKFPTLKEKIALTNERIKAETEKLKKETKESKSTKLGKVEKKKKK